jgi:hypothetical protein
VDRPAPAITEFLAVPEFGAFVLSAPLLAAAPRGSGRRVLVLPGFTAGDVSTAPMRMVLRALGHRPAPWGLGLNVGPDDETVRQLVRKLDELYEQNGGPIDIVGWSLGGIMARLMALYEPDRVRQVISLGSPIRVEDPEANLSESVRRLSQLAGLQRGRRGHDLTVIPVPSTVIYSRNDGVVAPASCLQPVGPRSENIEVRGPHTGLGHNVAAVWAVADRLAQRDGEWAPFVPPAPMSWCYPDPERPASPTARAVGI